MAMLESSENVSSPSRFLSSSDVPPGYSSSHTVLISIFVSIIMIIIVFGNLLVVVAIATDRQLKSIQNWFIASLAVADLFLGLIIMPFSLANELMRYWYFGSVWCDLWKAIDVLLCTASILSICLISLDRYWSITRALQYSSQRTPKRAALMITAVWILSAIVCVPPLIGWKNPLPVSKYPLCLLSSEVGYVISSCMGSFYIPALIMVVVYVKIYFAVKQRSKRARRNKHTRQETLGTGRTKMNQSPTKGKTANNQEFEQKSVMSEDESTWPVYRRQTITPKRQSDVEVPEESTSLLQKIENVKKLPDLIVVPVSGRTHHTETTDILGQDVIMEQKCLLQINESLKPKTTKNDDISRTQPSTEESYLSTSSVYDEDQCHEKKGDSKTVLNKNQTAKCSLNETPNLSDIEKQKRKLAKARERRATIVLGLVMAAFILCWFPFFTIYIATKLCNNCIPEIIFTIAFWAGYCNSALNPIIYTIFNQEFRNAFRKIIFKNALFKR